MNTFKTKRFWIGFLVTFGVTMLVAGTIFGLSVLNTLGQNKDPWDETVYVTLIDAFSIAGVLGMLFYFLSLLSTAGAFDILGYSMKLVWYNTFHRNVRDTALPKTYAEYKQIKRGKKPNSLIFMLFGSLPALVIGFIFMIPYYTIAR